ncbi:MAG: hypothetical protein PHS92_02375 [Candidatus Gracilibacteria bacterium]|nr:hypothetical protein [Candidatus Gracilibacteria bacterium]
MGIEDNNRSSECSFNDIDPILLSLAAVRSDAAEIMDNQSPEEIYKRLKASDDANKPLNQYPLATKQQIVSLFNGFEIHESYLTYRRWPDYAKNFNLKKNNVRSRGFQLPISYPGLIGALGGDYKSSSTKAYVLSLLK